MSKRMHGQYRTDASGLWRMCSEVADRSIASDDDVWRL